MLSTRTLRQEVLNESPPPGAASIASRSVQDFIFAFIFGFFRTIAESVFDFFKIVILPIAMGINIVQLYKRQQHYSRNKNKTVWQTLSLSGDWVATGLESIAVLLIISAVVGGAVLSAFIIPALFVAGVALRWLDNCVQSIYWGAKVLFGEKGTKQQEENWRNLKKSSRGLMIFTAAGLVIGLLMLSPAAGLLIPLYATTLVQTAGAFVLAVNAFFVGREAYHAHQKKYPQGLIFKNNYAPLDASLELEEVSNSSKLNTLSTSDIKKNIGFGSTDTEEQLKTAVALRNRYRLDPRFKDLRKNHIDDLLRKIEADDKDNGPQALILGFIGQAKKALADSLGCHSTPTLDHNCQLPSTIEGKPWDHQKQKRKDKLHAVLLMEKLVLKQPVVIRKQGARTSDEWISDMTKLLAYFKKTGKEKNLFESLFTPTGVGATQKLFVAVNTYLTTPEFQPKTAEREQYLDAQSSLGMKKSAS